MGDVMQVSREWLEEQRARESKEGWPDGPVWRSPAEIAILREQQRRTDNAAASAVIRPAA